MVTNPQTIAIAPLSLTVPPAGGPQALRTVVDFTAGGTLAYTIQLQQAFDQSKIGQIQSIYVDNSGNNAQVTLRFQASGQTIKVAPGVQGFIPVMFAPGANSVDTECTSGTGPFYVHFLNVLVPYQLWSSVSVGGFIFNASGYLLVSDPVLDACIVGGAVAVSNAALTALGTTIAAGAVAVSNGGLTELAAAINANRVDVNIAAQSLDPISVREKANSYSHITTATTTVVKNAAGTLSSVSVNTPVGASTITIYDNTSAAGTVVAIIDSSTRGTNTFNIAMGTGITVVTSGATDVTVSYA